MPNYNIRAQAYSIVKSSGLTLVASILGYLTIAILARLMNSTQFTEYLLVFAWGTIAVLVIDIASEQCLVHFSTKMKVGIEHAWLIVTQIKILVIGALGLILYLGPFVLGVHLPIPSAIVFFVIPGFYMGPIYEYYGKNVEYASRLLAEKIIFLMACIVVIYYKIDIYILYILYLFTTVLSLVSQIYSKISQLKSAFSAVKLGAHTLTQYLAA